MDGTKTYLTVGQLVIKEKWLTKDHIPVTAFSLFILDPLAKRHSNVVSRWADGGPLICIMG